MPHSLKQCIRQLGYALFFTVSAPLVTVTTANAALINFYTNEAAFLAASSTTLIDFEGIVVSNSFVTADPVVVGGVSFDQFNAGLMTVCGSTSICVGAPFDSTVLSGLEIEVDLTGAGSGFTAAGGFFGDASDPGVSGKLELFGLGNLLIDTRNVTLGDMGAGEAHTFFGWTISGDDITAIKFTYTNGAAGVIDDFRFGSSVAVAEPAVLAVYAMGLFGMGIIRRRFRIHTTSKL